MLQVLGAGGMGMVFLAEDTKLQRRVALKVIKPELLRRPDLHERFLSEARAIAKIEHDNIVAIFQVDDRGGVPFLAMPLLQGESLEERLHAAAPLSIDAILSIGREIAAGLQAAHERGLVHRDIKPSNIWLESGSPGSGRGVLGKGMLPSGHAPRTKHQALPRVKILDFGLACSLASDQAGQGNIEGTPAYMSPERAQGMPIDVRSDLFSLGSVLYRMTTGKQPFKGQTIVQTLYQLTTEEPAPPQTLNRRLPRDFAALIQRLLAKNPDQRPASAQEVVEAITAIEQARQPRLGRRWLLATAALVVGAIAVTYWLGPWSPPEPPEPVAVTLVYHEADPHVILRRDDAPEQQVKLEGKTTQTLLPGTYTVRPLHPTANRQLLPANFTVAANEPVEIELRLVGEISRQEHLKLVRSVALSPEPKSLIALSGSDDRTLGIWNAAKADDVKFLEKHESPIRCVAFSADGKRAASGSGMAGRAVEHVVRLWDVDRRAPLDLVLAHPRWVTAVAFVPRKNQLLSACNDGVAYLWDLDQAKIVHHLAGHEEAIKQVAIHPQGHQALTAGRDKRLILWDLAQGARVRALEGHRAEINGVAYSPDGKKAASVDWDGTVRVWDPSSGDGQVLRELKQPLHAVAWSPDGSRLAIASEDGTWRLVRSDNGADLYTFTGHRGPIYSVAFSADGRRVLSGSADRTVRLWELPK